jgi:flagellar hook-basal body complex protein FliE
MLTSMIDTSRIDAMVSQLRAAATRAEGNEDARIIEGGLMANAATQASASAPQTGFAEALRASLDGVNAMQSNAAMLGQKFASGDPSVELADSMIASQKASIGFAATLQVRNKIVSAYQEVMNMQV